MRTRAARETRLAADGPSTRPPTDVVAAMMTTRNVQRASNLLVAALVKAKERAAAALLALAAADLEVASLTAETKAADARLPAKPQCRSAPQKAWETTTAGWTTKQWVDLEAASRCRHGAQRACWP